MGFSNTSLGLIPHLWVRDYFWSPLVSGENHFSPIMTEGLLHFNPMKSLTIPDETDIYF